MGFFLTKLKYFVITIIGKEEEIMGFSVHPTSSDHGPPEGHLKVPVDKGVERLNGLLNDLSILEGDVPPAVQQVLDLRTQLLSLLGTKDLSEMHGIIPALNKTMASLQPIVHQAKQELERSDTIDYDKGPFSSAWTQGLLDKAIAELTSMIGLLE